MTSIEQLLPESVSLLVAVLLIAASFFTSAITAAIGIGGGLAMLALMSIVLPIASLIPVHGLVQVGSNAGRAWRMRSHIGWTQLLPFLIGGAFGAALGAAIVIDLPNDLLKIILGIFVILVTWFSVPKAFASGPLVVGIGGFVTTALAMFLGATGPLVIALFAKAFGDRQALVASAALAMAAQHGFKIVAFGFFGFAFGAWLPLALIMIGVGYLGTIVGHRLLGAMDEQVFRKVFKIGLTLLALDMIRRGLGL